VKSHFADEERLRRRGENSGEIHLCEVSLRGERLRRQRLWTNTYCEVSLRRRRETSTPRGNYRFPDPLFKRINEL